MLINTIEHPEPEKLPWCIYCLPVQWWGHPEEHVRLQPLLASNVGSIITIADIDVDETGWLGNTI